MVEKAQVGCSSQVASAGSQDAQKIKGHTYRIILISDSRLALGDIGPHRRQARIDSLTDGRAVKEGEQRCARPDLEVDRSINAEESMLRIVHEVRFGLASGALWSTAKRRGQTLHQGWASKPEVDVDAPG